MAQLQAGSIFGLDEFLSHTPQSGFNRQREKGSSLSAGNLRMCCAIAAPSYPDKSQSDNGAGRTMLDENVVLAKIPGSMVQKILEPIRSANSNLEERVEFLLNDVVSLDELNHYAATRVAPYLLKQVLPIGTILYEEGQPAACAYLVKKGQLKVSSKNRAQEVVSKGATIGVETFEPWMPPDRKTLDSKQLSNNTYQSTVRVEAGPAHVYVIRFLSAQLIVRKLPALGALIDKLHPRHKACDTQVDIVSGQNIVKKKFKPLGNAQEIQTAIDALLVEAKDLREAISLLRKGNPERMRMEERLLDIEEEADLLEAAYKLALQPVQRSSTSPGFTASLMPPIEHVSREDRQGRDEQKLAHEQAMLSQLQKLAQAKVKKGESNQLKDEEDSQSCTAAELLTAKRPNTQSWRARDMGLWAKMGFIKQQTPEDVSKRPGTRYCTPRSLGRPELNAGSATSRDSARPSSDGCRLIARNAVQELITDRISHKDRAYTARTMNDFSPRTPLEVPERQMRKRLPAIPKTSTTAAMPEKHWEAEQAQYTGSSYMFPAAAHRYQAVSAHRQTRASAKGTMRLWEQYAIVGAMGEHSAAGR